jgi:[lysine-biosynthesis-protein LysW]--L-2-aminoadipate ligase
VTAAIGVLCARIRVEEKQLLAALAEAGVPAMPLAPTACPYPFSPVPTSVGRDGLTGQSTGPTLDGAHGVEVVIDRLADRALAAAFLPFWQAQGKAVLDAGLAATGNRAVAAAALAASELLRPMAFLAASEEAAIAALAATGYPATLLPLNGGAAITLWDEDTAEAVLEHRSVLGDTAAAVVIVQAGAPVATERVLVHVVGGEAVAADDPGQMVPTTPAIVELAEGAARALGAVVAAVEIALTPAGVVVWDVLPAADFRHASALHDRSVAAAIAALAAAHLAARPSFGRSVRVQVHAGTGVDLDEADAEDGPEVVAVVPSEVDDAWREVGRDAVLTA